MSSEQSLVLPKRRTATSTDIENFTKAKQFLHNNIQACSNSFNQSFLKTNAGKSLTQIRSIPKLIDPQSTNESVKDSRSSKLHRIKGFKTYHRLKKYMKFCTDLCDNIERLKSRRTSLFPDVLEEVAATLDQMTEEESLYFKLSDQNAEYERKLKEIEYLKQKIDDCARNSVFLMQEQMFPDTESNAPANNHLKTNGTNCRDYRLMVQTIEIYMSNRQNEEDVEFQNGGTNIDEEIKETRELITFLNQQKSVYNWLYADYYSISFQEHFKHLTTIQEYFTESLIRHQAASKFLLDITNETNKYRKTLQKEIEVLQNAQAEKDMARVAEEEEKLFEFVNLAKKIHAEEEQERMARKVKTMSKALPPLPDLKQDFEKIPIWQRAWMPGKRVNLLHGRTDPHPY